MKLFFIKIVLNLTMLTLPWSFLALLLLMLINVFSEEDSVAEFTKLWQKWANF